MADLPGRLPGPRPSTCDDDDRRYVLVHKWTQPCGQCGAPKGEPCHTSRGYPRASHESRKRAILKARDEGRALTQRMHRHVEEMKAVTDRLRASAPDEHGLDDDDGIEGCFE